MRLRRGVLALTLAATVVVAPALPAGAAVDVVFDGSGWGHGVGMSQYGAYGMTAIGGADFKDVLAHYYTGSTVQHLDDLSVPVEPLWVNLERDRSSVVLIAKQTGLGDPADVVVTRGDETWTVGVNERIDIDWVNGTRTCDLEIRARRRARSRSTVARSPTGTARSPVTKTHTTRTGPASTGAAASSCALRDHPEVLVRPVSSMCR